MGIKARVLCLAFRKNLCVQIKDLRKNKGQRKINSKKKLASPLLFSLSLSLSPPCALALFYSLELVRAIATFKTKG